MVVTQMHLKYSLIAALFFIIIGCSSPPTAPDLNPQTQVNTNPASGHVVWGQWDISIDPVTGDASASPVRDADFHINVTTLLEPPGCTDCIQVIIAAWDPVKRIVDITLVLKNPTLLDGYDVKAIISGYDTKEFLDPDAWTDLHNDTGTRNPYYVFAVDGEDNFFGAEQTHTRGIQVYFPVGSSANATITVDASWPGPQAEPWKIDNVLVLGPLQNDNHHHIGFTCHIYDHQGDTAIVLADLGEIALGFQPMGDDSLHLDYLPNDGIWGLDDITTSAQTGPYDCWVQAGQIGGETLTYQQFEIEVILPIFNQPPLYIVSVMQAEADEDYLDETIFTGYADTIRSLKGVFDLRGGKIELQPDWTFIQGQVDFDPTLFNDFRAAGHGVSAHSFDEELYSIGDVNIQLGNAGVSDPVTAAGGFGSTLDEDTNWSAYVANFETVGGNRMFLASSSYRDPVTLAIDGLRTPIRPTLTGTDWMVHDPDGPLVYIGGAGTRVISAGNIDFFNNLPLAVDYALAGVIPDRINVYYWYDPVRLYSGDPLSETRLTFWALTLEDYFEDKVADGDVIWANFVEIYEAYLDWES